MLGALLTVFGQIFLFVAGAALVVGLGVTFFLIIGVSLRSAVERAGVRRLARRSEARALKNGPSRGQHPESSTRQA